MELFVVILFNGGDLFAYSGKLANLILDLVLEQADLVLQVLNAELIEHDHIMISVVTQQALEANGAQIILTKGLDFLRLMDLASTVLKLADLVVTHPLSLTLLCNSNIIIISSNKIINDSI